MRGFTNVGIQEGIFLEGVSSDSQSTPWPTSEGIRPLKKAATQSIACKTITFFSRHKTLLFFSVTYIYLINEVYESYILLQCIRRQREIEVNEMLRLQFYGGTSFFYVKWHDIEKLENTNSFLKIFTFEGAHLWSDSLVKRLIREGTQL